MTTCAGCGELIPDGRGTTDAATKKRFCSLECVIMHTDERPIIYQSKRDFEDIRTRKPQPADQMRLL